MGLKLVEKNSIERQKRRAFLITNSFAEVSAIAASLEVSSDPYCTPPLSFFLFSVVAVDPATVPPVFLRLPRDSASRTTVFALRPGRTSALRVDNSRVVSSRGLVGKISWSFTARCSA